MTTPHPILSAPILFSPAQLRSNADLTLQITSLVNEAFRRSKEYDPEIWDSATPRFLSNESYYEMLGERGIVALIFDKNNGAESLNGTSGSRDQAVKRENGSVTGQVIACAAALPWKGGWAKEGAGKEEGWEIKAVAVHKDEKYLRKGLAVKAMKALEEDLIEKAKVQRQTCAATGQAPLGKEQNGVVTLWLLVAECINGPYWRKKGYQEVRRSTEGGGTWGCKTSFEMVVYRKDVEFGWSDEMP